MVAAAHEVRNTVSLDRFAAYRADPADGVDEADALEVVHELAATGFEQLLAEHRSTWSSRWQAADVRVEGDPELQLAVRFALFHLMASAPEASEAAVGARGLTGPAYRGHVFWDSDVFVLPFLAATPPRRTRDAQYRITRLDDARAAAHALGREGARFAWESASTASTSRPSTHATRPAALSRSGRASSRSTSSPTSPGRRAATRTGAATTFLEDAGRDLLVETARYWASRIRLDGDGRGHIYGVIGPDEYHEPVDDNAFTNVMARWNLRRAAGVSRHRAARAGRVAGARPRSSTATTRERASTSSSPASTASSRS